MNAMTQDIPKIKELVEKAKDILVVTHEHPTMDSMGSALALYLGLSNMGKRVTVACPDPMTVEHSNFVGANKLVSAVGKKNFIISLDYIEGSIDKVSYNIEGNKFNLVIEPRPGFDSFSENNVHYTRSGMGADLIITVDTLHLGGLKEIYENDKDLFTGKPVVNIDRHPNNSRYGQINVIDSTVSSTAELMAVVMSSIGVKLTEDIATNILNALYSATDNFQSANISGRTFEVAAVCMKAGGKRFTPSVPAGSSFPAVQPQEPRVSEPELTPAPVMPEPVLPEPVEPMVAPEPQQPVPVASPPVQTPRQDTQVNQHDQMPPEEWLKPKIFKSSRS